MTQQLLEWHLIARLICVLAKHTENKTCFHITTANFGLYVTGDGVVYVMIHRLEWSQLEFHV